MKVKITSSEQDVMNMDRHLVFECGHTADIMFEQLRGKSARPVPKAGQMFDCVLCGPEPEPTVAESQGPIRFVKEPNEETTQKPKDLTMPDARPLDVKLKELLGVTKLESKLARIKAILEEE